MRKFEYQAILVKCYFESLLVDVDLFARIVINVSCKIVAYSAAKY